MKNLKIFGWDKPKTLYRYISPGDIFCYQIAEKLYGYGRIITKNKWGATAEFFDYFTLNPAENFNYININDYLILFKCILDCVTLFQAKLESDWRIIAQDPNYININPNEITSINIMDGIANNADFTYFEILDKKEALNAVMNKPELDETPHSHYHILNLLIIYKPNLFSLKNAPFIGFDCFINEEFKDIYNIDLKLKCSETIS